MEIKKWWGTDILLNRSIFLAASVKKLSVKDRSKPKMNGEWREKGEWRDEGEGPGGGMVGST